jgi:hypothetical protein
VSCAALVERNCATDPSVSVAVTPLKLTTGSVTLNVVAWATTILPMACVNSGGTSRPMSCRRLTAYPDQPTATTEAARPYSSSSNEPMIQAPNSPMVVYE